ncbi:hypothetical protein [Macrococcus epidermidis]|uniref:hypothetical protein n=1 Tax=Macrococcus epidermidis TaxID=1902580 RepID=UPI0020B7695B|nr:hypothetical protein [Macrococcus epidermidis]UTH16244.1 hypothetical protein KFV12_00230 [Macrococcus epidermidis]
MKCINWEAAGVWVAALALIASTVTSCVGIQDTNEALRESIKANESAKIANNLTKKQIKNDEKNNILEEKEKVLVYFNKAESNLETIRLYSDNILSDVGLMSNINKRDLIFFNNKIKQTSFDIDENIISTLSALKITNREFKRLNNIDDVNKLNISKMNRKYIKRLYNIHTINKEIKANVKVIDKRVEKSKSATFYNSDLILCDGTNDNYLSNIIRKIEEYQQDIIVDLNRRMSVATNNEQDLKVCKQ